MQDKINSYINYVIGKGVEFYDEIEDQSILENVEKLIELKKKYKSVQIVSETDPFGEENWNEGDDEYRLVAAENIATEIDKIINDYEITKRNI